MEEPRKIKNEIRDEIKKIPPTTDRNLMAALSYVWLLAIVMLLVKGSDPFVKFHAKQALILVILTILGWIPVIGWIIWVLAVAGMVMGFINAWQGKEYRLPLVAGWAERYLKF